MTNEFKPRGYRTADDVHKALRIRAAETGEPMADILDRALRRELGMATTEVRSMSEQDLNEKVIGKVWDTKNHLGLDWIQVYPVVNADGTIAEIIDADDAPETDGLFFDELNDCYRYESEYEVCDDCQGSAKGANEVCYDQSRRQWMTYRGGWYPCESCGGIGMKVS